MCSENYLYAYPRYVYLDNSFRFQYFDFKIHARYTEINSLQGAKI